MNTQIEVGDYVRHLDSITNNGLQMSVVEVDEDQVRCGYFDSEGIHKEDWFHFRDLLLVNKAEGGFFDQ